MLSSAKFLEKLRKMSIELDSNEIKSIYDSAKNTEILFIQDSKYPGRAKNKTIVVEMKKPFEVFNHNRIQNRFEKVLKLLYKIYKDYPINPSFKKYYNSEHPEPLDMLKLIDSLAMKSYYSFSNNKFDEFPFLPGNNKNYIIRINKQLFESKFYKLKNSSSHVMMFDYKDKYYVIFSPSLTKGNYSEVKEESKDCKNEELNKDSTDYEKLKEKYKSLKRKYKSLKKNI